MIDGLTNIGIWRTCVAVELGEHGQDLEATKTVLRGETLVDASCAASPGAGESP